MAGGIALLGWGSLLWDNRDPFDQSHDAWQFDGPTICLEFSRVSTSRRGALTLVVDTQHGVPVQVAWCRSRRSTLQEAAEDLRKRERANDRHIGRYTPDGQQVFRDKDALEAIRRWATKHQLQGVVWTDLPGNFSSIVTEPFSVDAALRYLSRLEGDARTEAITYLRQAPGFVRTPLREAFVRDFGAG